MVQGNKVEEVGDLLNLNRGGEEDTVVALREDLSKEAEEDMLVALKAVPLFNLNKGAEKDTLAVLKDMVGTAHKVEWQHHLNLELFLLDIKSKAYDRHLNMILGDVEETITIVEIDDETYEEIVRGINFMKRKTRTPKKLLPNRMSHAHLKLLVKLLQDELCGAALGFILTEAIVTNACYCILKIRDCLENRIEICNP